MKSLFSKTLNLSRIITLLILAIFLFDVINTPVASAQEVGMDNVIYPDDYDENDILYYNRNAKECAEGSESSTSGGGSSDTGGTGATGGETSSSSLSGNDNPTKIFNYLVGKGLSNEEAAGVLGNIGEEGGFSPTRQEDNPRSGRGGWGLVQWTADRRDALIDYIASRDSSLLKYESDTAKYGGSVSASTGYVHKNVPIEDNDKLLAIELDFLYAEATSRPVKTNQNGTTHREIMSKYGGMKEWDAVNKSNSLADASNIWMLSFEKPGNQSEAKQQGRITKGEEQLARITGSGGSSGGSGGSSSSGSSGSSSSSSSGSGTAMSGCTSSSDGSGSGDGSGTGGGSGTGDSSGTGGGSGAVASGSFASTVKSYIHPTWKPGEQNPMPAFRAAADKAASEGRYTGQRYTDCGGFVTTLLVDSGFEPRYNSGPKGSTSNGQPQWLEQNWTKLGRGGQVDTATLQPGDVWIKPGHTFVYIGDIEGISTNRASASKNERAPMAGTESLSNPSGNWWRKP